MRGGVRAAGRAARSTFSIFAAVGDVRLQGLRSRPARAERMRVMLAEVAAIHGMRIAVEGAWPAGPCVIAANHVGYLDPIAIGSQLACTALAKHEVARWPLIGGAAATLGAIFVDRGCTYSRAAALLGAIRALRDGVSVLNFPEGTTTDGERVKPFASGIFGAARLAGVPVVPLAIRYGSPRAAWTGGETFLPHYARTAARSSLSALIAIGAPIDPHAHASAMALAVAARRAVVALLRPEPEDPHEPRVRAVVPPPRVDAVLPPAERRLHVA
jgi:1-acyl-sn-glycerol-3-phosphate acyltransferase